VPTAIAVEFLVCPHCVALLKQPCVACTRALEVSWKHCPYFSADQWLPGAEAQDVERALTAWGNMPAVAVQVAPAHRAEPVAVT
jgi:hypothetical protein